ncbi:MAG: hypothetical protein AAF602_21785, partial [Myxococcota bacterium]
EASANALRQVDANALRQRLAQLGESSALDTSETAERERLVGLLADLDGVEAGEATVADEASRLRSALAEVAAVLARWNDDAPVEALAELGRGARHVEEAVRATSPDDDEAARRRQRLLARARAERSPQ